MDAREHMKAAYALDHEGDERGAIRHYDAAYRLGVPEADEKGFLVGYGSTLRNVGRADDAVAILAAAVAKYPDYPALAAFLSLALLDTAGRLDGYDRALTEYHQLLLTPRDPG
jgi:tetratricopeptide (TPR) repeat protein